MTGYQSKKAMARDKLEQWDTPSEAFNAWWNGEYDDSTNPFTKHSLAYWAFAGWQAALAQPAQEPVVTIAVREHAPVGKVAYVLEVNLPVGIHNLYTTPPQRPWVGLTNNELQPIADEYRILFGSWVEDFARAIEAKLKEKNT